MDSFSITIDSLLMILTVLFLCNVMERYSLSTLTLSMSMCVDVILEGEQEEDAYADISIPAAPTCPLAPGPWEAPIPSYEQGWTMRGVPWPNPGPYPDTFFSLSQMVEARSDALSHLQQIDPMVR